MPLLPMFESGGPWLAERRAFRIGSVFRDDVGDELFATVCDAKGREMWYAGAIRFAGFERSHVFLHSGEL